MSISSISSIYSNLYASLVSKTKSADEASEATGGSGTSSLADILKLNTSEELSSYLNYDSSGNYSSRTSLSDYLTMDDEGTDLFRNSQSPDNSLMDILYPDSSEDSTSDIFDSLISTKSQEIENMIYMAMEKLDNTDK